MSWLSKWIDKKSGKNDAIDIEAQQGRYKQAMSGVTAGYDKMMGIAEDQMDISSDRNMAMLSRMNESSADNAAESARLAQRTAASAGGAPVAAMAFQQQDMANKAQANTVGQFFGHMGQQQESALQTMGGVLANQGQMAQAGFNMGESAREYNKKVEARAQQRKAGMLSGALKIGGGLLMGNPGLALSGASSFMQEGGPVEDPENPKPVGNGQSDADSMLQLAMEQEQSGLGPEYWERRNKAQFKYDMRQYDRVKSGEKFKGMAKGIVGGGLIGTLTGGGSLAYPMVGGLYGRYKAGKRFEAENEDIVSKEDRAKWKQIQREGYQTGGYNSPLPGDIVDAKLEPGEYVLNRNAVNAVGKENLDRLNNEEAPRFDDTVKMRIGGYLYG